MVIWLKANDPKSSTPSGNVTRNPYFIKCWPLIVHKRNASMHYSKHIHHNTCILSYILLYIYANSSTMKHRSPCESPLHLFKKKNGKQRKHRARIPIPKRARSCLKWRSAFSQPAQEGIKNKRWRGNVSSDGWSATGSSKPGGTSYIKDKLTKEAARIHSAHPNPYYIRFNRWGTTRH